MVSDMTPCSLINIFNISDYSLVFCSEEDKMDCFETCVTTKLDVIAFHNTGIFMLTPILREVSNSGYVQRKVIVKRKTVDVDKFWGSL